MTKEIQPTGQLDILDKFANVQIDPFIKSVFEKMHLYNDLLEEQSVSSAQINEIMNELDDEWRQLMHQTVIVSGVVSFMDESKLGVDGEIREDFYEDHEMEFGGVFPVRIDLQSNFEEYVDDELHKYRLELRFSRDGITPEGKRIEMSGTAKANDIVGIEFPNAMSAERARHWLEYYKLDLLEDIEVALLNSSKEECEMTMRLKDIEFDARLPHDSEDMYTLRTMQALNIYTESLFAFDADAPYHIAVLGDAWQPGPDNILQSTEITGATMVAVDRIIWLAGKGGPDNLVKPHLVTRFLGTTKDDPDTNMYIPLTSITSFTSYRYAFFTGYPDSV